MTLLEATLRRVVSDLEELGKPWALIGGLAVSARAEPRATRDIDVALAVKDDSEAESTVFWFQSRGYQIHAALEHESAKRMSTVRLLATSGDPQGVIVDLLFASSGIEADLTKNAERLEILPDCTVPVASVGYLLALKVLAQDDRSRPQDSDDIRALLAEATAQDIEEAKAAICSIEQRGFNRNRQLMKTFNEMLENSRG